MKFQGQGNSQADNFVFVLFIQVISIDLRNHYTGFIKFIDAVVLRIWAAYIHPSIPWTRQNGRGIAHSSPSTVEFRYEPSDNN